MVRNGAAVAAWFLEQCFVAGLPDVDPVSAPTSAKLTCLQLVAPTGVDPVTFRFSVERSTN